MKYIKLFENFEEYDIYQLKIMPSHKKAEILFDEINKEDKANLNFVNDLLALRANLDWQDNFGETALHLCARWNSPEIARMLIDAGADVNIQRIGGETALHWCSRFNRPEISRMLIDAGVDVNIQDNFGFTALHWCANKNHPEVAQMLIDAGSDKTIPDVNGKLPYELADTQELKELLKP